MIEPGANIVIPCPRRSEIFGPVIGLGSFVAVFLLYPVSGLFGLFGLQRLPLATSIISIALACLFGVPFLARYSQWIDHSPSLAVTGRGVKLHPAYGGNFIPWSNLLDASLSEEFQRGSSSLVLTMRLNCVQRSWNYPVGRKAIRFGVSLGGRDAILLDAAHQAIVAAISRI